MIRVAGAFLVLCGLVAFIEASRAWGAVASGAVFQQSLVLSSGQTVVVEESSLEPRSIGSYSLRLYRSANPQFPYDDFVAGIILPRDGVLETVSPVSSRDCPNCIKVTMRSVGTGGYLSADIVSLSDNSPILRKRERPGTAGSR